ncbi:PEP-CTERM sorting domain-containing protein [Aquabacterium sp. OR-4]|uniref:PEP-CTERM sorting domain-containing protein n=1 Tax=Aquabacterium sp. OR-4 TaxID=2978127 RepID=UPI0028C5BB90|nr:PEP-CTERM sorting domain-containing protein [Aquabacterium sp. OR-4]MDT7838670.1 PEP-CTERM sorting domain-containing protein [Aquabacterium sp. OR-4]
MNLPRHPLFSARGCALRQAAAVLLLAGLAAPTHAAGVVVLDTYGPDIGHLDGWPTPLTAANSIAVPFQLGSGATVQSILTAIERNTDWPSSGGVTLGIAHRQGATPTAAAWLYSTRLEDPAVNTTVTPSGWALAAGAYWLLATADGGFAGQWISATQDDSGDWAYTTAPGSWTPQTSSFLGMPGARITVAAAVPEPASVGLMLAGGLIVAAALRRSAHARQG